MENNVKAFKKLINAVKKIPIILAITLFSIIISQFFQVNSLLIQIIFGSSILSVLFFYLSSYALHFCYYHRLPLYYIFITLIICLYDTYIGLPINLLWLFVIHIVLFLLMVVLLIKFYLK